MDRIDNLGIVPFVKLQRIGGDIQSSNPVTFGNQDIDLSAATAGMQETTARREVSPQPVSEPSTDEDPAVNAGEHTVKTMGTLRIGTPIVVPPLMLWFGLL